MAVYHRVDDISDLPYQYFIRILMFKSILFLGVRFFLQWMDFASADYYVSSNAQFLLQNQTPLIIKLGSGPRWIYSAVDMSFRMCWLQM